MQRYDKAVEALQKVERSDDNWVQATYLFGRLLEHAKHADAAMERYIEIVKSTPCNDETLPIYERLGRMYADQGEERAARKLLTAVVQREPTRKEAREALENLGRGTQNPSEALDAPFGGEPPRMTFPGKAPEAPGAVTSSRSTSPLSP